MARPVESESQSESLFLVYVNQDDAEDHYVETELEGLCEAAGVKVAGSVRQRLKRPDRATYIGKGKVEEIKAFVADTGADAVVVDAELSGAQLRNLEEEIEVRVPSSVAAPSGRARWRRIWRGPPQPKDGCVRRTRES